MDILVIPATSAPIKHVLSTAGKSTAGKRNCLSDNNFECEVAEKKQVFSLVAAH